MENKMACFLVLMLVVASPVFAARPLVTDDFGTVAPGKYELEAGYSAVRPRVGGAATKNEIGVSFKRGITSNFDLGIEVPYSLTAPTGLGDAVIHAKYKALVVSEEEGLTMRLDVKLANADANIGLGSGYLDYGLIAVYSKPFGELKTHYNLGYTIVGVPAGESSANKINYSVAVEKEVARGIEIVGEYCGVLASGTSTSNVQVGGRWQAWEAVWLDAGYSLALNDDSNNVATVGLTAEF